MEGDKPDLPSNFNICQHRTKNLFTKLKLTPTLLKLHNDIILEQERHGFIEQVTDSSATAVHHLSHHLVRLANNSYLDCLQLQL